MTDEMLRDHNEYKFAQEPLRTTRRDGSWSTDIIFSSSLWNIPSYKFLTSINFWTAEGRI